MSAAKNPLHLSVILHMDIDYFYAQVEEVLNPELKNKPFGVQQGVNIVTCNYIARSFGVKKWRPIKESLALCPDLVLVNGEDLSSYKIYSKKISELLHEMIGPTERMGLDEHFLDITSLVNKRVSEMSEEDLKGLHMTGPFFPSEEAFTDCECGCHQRLMIGSEIASTIPAKILEDLKLTCSIGVAHNKLLAKLIGQCNKPNNQTTLAPLSAAEYMAGLKDLRSIMGIGGKTASRIEELGIKSIEDLQNCDKELLQKKFGADMTTRLKDWAMGEDSSEFKPSGKPKTVGLEDSCRPFSIRSEAEVMFKELLQHLVHQIQDDGRVPVSLRVTVRKYDLATKTSNKETKQTPLLPSYFRFVDEKVSLADGASEKIMKAVMNLFDQLVNKQKFYINLVGLCFCKFQEQVKGSNSIASFLVQKRKMSDDEEIEKSEQTIETPPVFLKKLKTTERAELPVDIDMNVWKELPPDVQRELLSSWNIPKPEDSSTSCSLSNHFKKE